MPHFDPQRFDENFSNYNALQLIEIQDFVSVSPVELEPVCEHYLTAFYFLISQLYAALDVIMNMDTATVPINASKYKKILLPYKYYLENYFWAKFGL